MAGVRQRANGTWEFKFQRKGVLENPVYLTFDTEAEGRAYEKVAEEMLARGVAPSELVETKWRTLQNLFDAYELSEAVSKSDSEMFATVGKRVGALPLTRLTYEWLEEWVKSLSDEGLAPSTIKKRVEFIGRAIAWALRRGRLAWPNNPVKLLPKGYATRHVTNEKLWAGQRDRRLEARSVTVNGVAYATEEEALRSVLLKKEERLLFDMGLETAMRLREMFTLKRKQIDLARRTIFLDRTKNGSKRQVPISSVLLPMLQEALDGLAPEQEIFPWWKDPFPDKRELSKKELAEFKRQAAGCTNRLSNLWAKRFASAGCPDLHFHDLRHEATSRLYERTTMSDVKIASITGHTNLRMLQRYANLRASNLASEMW